MGIEPIVKVKEMAYPRLQAPDLDAMEAFLTDFGMGCGPARTKDTLYMRGFGLAPLRGGGAQGRAGLSGFRLRSADTRRPRPPGRERRLYPGRSDRCAGRRLAHDDEAIRMALTGRSRSWHCAACADRPRRTPRPLNMGSKFERIDAAAAHRAGPEPHQALRASRDQCRRIPQACWTGIRRVSA